MGMMRFPFGEDFVHGVVLRNGIHFVRILCMIRVKACEKNKFMDLHDVLR